jgi:hypothetical protein
VRRVDTGFAVGPKDHAHFLEHVAVIIDTGLVDADGDRYSRGGKPV